MSDWITKRGGWWLLVIATLAFWGCSGGNSETGEQETTMVAQSFNEDCMLCHRSGSIAAVADVHSKENGSPQGEIASVAIDGGTGTVTINFSLFDSENNLVPLGGVDAAAIRFTLAKLVPGADGLLEWQSYINTTEVKTADEPGTATDGNTTIQATAERASTTGGTFTEIGAGLYSYQMSFDINNIISPVAVPYEPTRTHRVAMQVEDNVSNAVLDFVPAGGVPTETRSVVDNASCNSCHIQLAFHGGDRIQTGYCVTCHNPGSADANSDNTVDFTVMIHKIHAGETLPEVEAGGEYAIWGFGNGKHDYSEVVYPQDLRNCTKCHDGADAATPDGDNWKNAPSIEACTSCHGVPDAVEYPGFPNLTPAQIEEAHQIESQIAMARFEYNIISITNSGPGQNPVVTFSVTDPTNADAAYDILSDPAFTAGGGASRLAVLIGWPTSSYTNISSGNVPAQPVSINPLSAGSATDNGNGTFTVTSPEPVPATVTGSGAVAIEGHPAADFDGDGVYSDRVPVTNVVQPFPITRAAEPRRTVVSVAACKECHGTLSAHGDNRTDNTQVCVICHNADATDINRRPAASEALDNNAEQAIDFKFMIHAIHAGDVDLHGFREEGVVLYGFGNTSHDFSGVRMPSGLENLKNCQGCHTGESFTIPISDNALPTTVDTGDNLASPDDDENITPTAAACSSCHDSLAAKTHMVEQGASFDFVPFAPETPAETDTGEVALCGPGPIASQPAGHSARTDCCSCHGFQ